MSNLDQIKVIQAKIEALKNIDYVKSVISDPEKQALLTKLEATIEELGKLYE